MSKRLIVIGGVAAGMSAAAKAKRIDRDMEAVVYERGRFISYAACGMPYYIAGDILDHQSLLARTPEQMEKQGVTVHLRHEVIAIDADAHTVTVRDLEQEREFSQTYDRLVIATGARPVTPPLVEPGLAGVFVLRALEEGIAVKSFLENHAPQQALIVGGGYVGVEMAESFRRLGLETRMLVRSGAVMRTALDDDVREVLEGELQRQGVEILQGEPTALVGNDSVAAATTDNDQIPCQIALIGAGARPETTLAEAAGVELGRTGAIATDEYMRTNLPDVYAAGDCAEVFNLIAEKADYIPLGSTANKQGRTAGANAAGDADTFNGVVGTMVARAFDLAVARTGLTTSQAEALGYKVRAPLIKALDSSHYFPGAADIHVKLVVDDQSDRLLGGQIIGRKGVAKRIDVLATALHHRLSVADLQQLDLSYAPPFAPVWDPILIAANVAAK